MAIEYKGSDTCSAEAVIHDQVVYLAAQVALDPAPTVAEQTRQVLAQIDDSLGRCGTSKWKLLTATVFCSDTRNYDEVNTIWDAWVAWHDPPACTFMVAKLQSSRHRVAIQVTAGL